MSESWSGEALGVAPPEVGTPPDPVEDTLVAPLLHTLVDCLCNELAASLGGAPCFCGIVPGALVAMDFCDCASGHNCGMGWVRLDSLYPSRVFPTQDTDAKCGTLLAARIAVGVTRCQPSMDDRGNPPTVLAQTMAASIQMADMAAQRRAIACCLEPATKYVLGAYTPIGPAGDCGGGQWVVTVQVN